MSDTPLFFPALGPLYATLAPLAEALLRVVVGLWMVPHGLRMAFGFFPGTGLPHRNVHMLAVDLDKWGYRPGKLWAPLIAATELIAGPMLALGLFTRVAAVPLVLFLIVTNFRALARRRLFLEQARTGIHHDVARRDALFPGARRRTLFARPLAHRPRVLTAPARCDSAGPDRGDPHCPGSTPTA
jgi:putative oxidoreductase